jgi:CheY-like chemotaxis protein
MRPSVLLVEDEPPLREMMVLLLDMEGFDVIPVANGVDALTYLRGGGNARLILLDLMMPQMDGWTFRREQRADPSIAAIPVIVLSSCDSAPELEPAAYLRKPVDMADVLKAARVVCR